jgi:hypothetical protein
LIDQASAIPSKRAYAERPTADACRSDVGVGGLNSASSGGGLSTLAQLHACDRRPKRTAGPLDDDNLDRGPHRSQLRAMRFR